MQTIDETERKVIVAKRVRAARGEDTREGFAERLGYRRISSGAQQIWRWETGKTLPSQNGAFLLSRLTGKSVGFFLGEDDPEEEAPADLLSELHAFLDSRLKARAVPANV